MKSLNWSLLVAVVVFSETLSAQLATDVNQPPATELQQSVESQVSPPADTAVEVINIEQSPIPGFLAIRCHWEAAYWQNYLVHLPVKVIDQITSGPEETVLFISALRLPGEKESRPAEFAVPHNVMNDEEIIVLVSDIMKSTIARIQLPEPATASVPDDSMMP
ncbi:MAG: hypothetical protein AAGH72_13010 [Verrucomicrobiota bacterium]